MTITGQPQGGMYVQSLSCTMTIEVDATRVSMDGPAGGTTGFRVRWVTNKGNHKTEEAGVQWARGEQRSRAFTTTFSAPTGYYLDKTFWVEVRWSDHAGRHNVKSSPAECFIVR